MVLFQAISNRIFNHIHQNNLIYNTCWEDPSCDRALLDFNTDSNIVMITSAGCNALAYLLDDPAHINAIDMNPRQNAVLDFKLALFQKATYSDLFQYFGRGRHQEHLARYNEVVKPQLKKTSIAFWQQHVKHFSPQAKRSFYFSGTSGWMAWMVRSWLKMRQEIFAKTNALINAADLSKQQALFAELEPKVFNRFMQFFVNRHITMCMLGVPKSQQELFFNQYDKGAMGFIQERLRHVFSSLSLKDNYFYRVYLTGEYTSDCCPDYLKEENFDTIAERADKISLHENTISNFLETHPGEYSHYILLDHQDWLAQNDVDELQREWKLILKNSKPGTKILMRSAADKIDFLPEFVTEAVDFNKIDTEKQHFLDRVGTYASVAVGIVK